MKTIEERAEEFARTNMLKDEERRVGKEAFISGAESEHTLLTEWHDPEKERPRFSEPVIVKYISKDNPFINCYTVGKGMPIGSDFICESEFVKNPKCKIVGWREID